MATLLKQSTAVDIAMGPFLDATDGVTAETALTITQPDIRLKKNGGAWAQKNAAQTLSHEENGWYEVALDTMDTNALGILVVAIAESGALPVWREFLVVPANVYDALVAGSDNLEVDTTLWLGTAAQGASGRPQVDVELWLGSAPNALQSGRVDAYVGAVAAGVIAAASFAAGALDAVWSVASRVLTAGTNIVLAKGTGVTGFNDLDAAGVRSAVGLASANLDTQLAALPTAAENADQVWDEAISGHQTAGTTGKALTDAGGAGTPPTAAAIADAVWDEAMSGHLGAGSTGAKLNAATGAGGAGAISWDVLVQVGVTPQQAVAVWVTTDAAGSNVVAGTLITPSNGTVTFLLDAGTYYLWARKDGLNPVNAQSFVVS